MVLSESEVRFAITIKKIKIIKIKKVPVPFSPSGDVMPGANSRYLNVWSEYRTTQYDIYANLDVQMIGVEEQVDKRESISYLKSTVVKNTIEIVNAKEQAEIFDAIGNYLGKTTDGVYDCSRLNAGVYFVHLKSGKTYKVIKVR